MFLFVFFFNDTATTEIYTLSLHDALPICFWTMNAVGFATLTKNEASSDLIETSQGSRKSTSRCRNLTYSDRKSTRLNSSHANISYAVFCLKKTKHKLSNALHLVLW